MRQLPDTGTGLQRRTCQRVPKPHGSPKPDALPFAFTGCIAVRIAGSIADSIRHADARA
jgi:hypothetical protein